MSLPWRFAFWTDGPVNQSGWWALMPLLTLDSCS